MPGAVFSETKGHGSELAKGGGREVWCEGFGDVDGFGDDVQVFAEEENEFVDEDLGIAVCEWEVVRWIKKMFWQA